MNAYLALTRIDLRLAFRNKAVIFFNYLFPLIFFFVFAGLMHADRDPAIASDVVDRVIVLGLMGSGLFGAGMRAVQEREANILRRYKVAPITPLPLLIASVITGWVIFIPAAVLFTLIAHYRYAMPMPAHLGAYFGLITLGMFCFRAIGLIIASVVNSMQESNIMIQLFYMPMLFLSGTTVPVEMLPKWGKVLSKFLPASYLVTGFRRILENGETLLQNWGSALALVIALITALFVATQLFRWEKEEKIQGTAKLWVLVALLPFIVLGCYQIFKG